MIVYKQFRWGFSLLLLLIGAVICNSCDEDDPQVLNDKIILLEVIDEAGQPLTELLGDGQTLLKLKAKIPNDSDNKYRKVTFKASKGQFMATSTTGEYQKVVNADGIAEVYLKVPLDHGPLFLSAEIGSDSDKYFSEKQVTLIDVGQVITLQILDSSGNPVSGGIRADGNTMLTLKATVNFNTDAITSIKFTASAGSFSSIGVQNNTVATSGNVATIQFKVPKTAGDVYFKAEVPTNANVSQSSTLTLGRAYADQLFLEPSTLLIDSPDDQVTVSTHLVRDIGYVSTGTSAGYAAFQTDGSGNEIVVGRFIGLAEAKTDEHGQITSVKFVPDTGDIDFGREITIRVTTRNDSNQEIFKSFILNN